MPRAAMSCSYGAILTVVLAGAFFAGPWMASAETIRFEDMRKGTPGRRGAMLRSWSIGLRHRVRTRVLHPLLRLDQRRPRDAGRSSTCPVTGPASSRAATRYDDPKFKRDDDTRRMAKAASQISEAAATTAIYLARIGVGGSSGHHSQRRTMAELSAYSLALDALKARYKFEGFDMIGQSGGATLDRGVAGIPHRHPLRRARLGIARRKTPTPARHRSFPAAFPPGRRYCGDREEAQRCGSSLSPNRTTRTVPRENQDPFVQKVRAAGGKVQQYYVQLTNERSATAYRLTRSMRPAPARRVSTIARSKAALKKIEERVVAKAAERRKRSGTQDDDDERPTRRQVK